MAFFAADFFGAAAFFVVGGAVAFVLVTRPDLVLVSTFGTSTIAGAYERINIRLRIQGTKKRTAVGVLAAFLALGLAVLAFGVAAAVFFAAGAFFAVVALVAVLFGGAFLVVVIEGVAFGLVSLGSFCLVISDAVERDGHVLVTDLGGSCFGCRWLGLLLRKLDWSRWALRDACES